MEVSIMLFLQNLREQLPQVFNQIFIFLSAFIVSPVPLLAVILVLWCFNKRAGYFMLFCTTCTAGLGQALKNIACIYRPWILDPRIVPDMSALPDATGYSFPSGHTSMASGVFFSAAYCLRRHRALCVACIALAVLIGFSRCWLGCHMPKDVLVALAIGAAVLFAVNRIFAYVQEHPEKDVIIAAAGFIVSTALLVLCATKSYPVDLDAAGNMLVDPAEMVPDCYKSLGGLMAVFLGWIIERRFIRFSTNASNHLRLARGIVGIVLAGALFFGIQYGLGQFVPLSTMYFVKYFTLVMFALVIWPACFTAYESRLAKQ